MNLHWLLRKVIYTTNTVESVNVTLRNPDLELKEGATLTVYAENDLTKLAENTRFKHVPQLGQILTDEGLATKEQVDAVFGKQGDLKKILADVRKAAGF